MALRKRVLYGVLLATSAARTIRGISFTLDFEPPTGNSIAGTKLSTTLNSTDVGPTGTASPNSGITCIPHKEEFYRPDLADCDQVITDMYHNPNAGERYLYTKVRPPPAGAVDIPMSWRYQNCYISIGTNEDHIADYTTERSLSISAMIADAQCLRPPAPRNLIGAAIRAGEQGFLLVVIHGRRSRLVGGNLTTAL